MCSAQSGVRASMASIGHIAVGMAAGRWYAGAGGRPSWRPMVAFSVLSLVPDLDVLGFRFGIAYGDAWGHRGASHSLLFGVALGALSAALAARSGHPARRVFVLASLVAMSHGLLDTLTDGGLGAALLWPFDEARIFAPWNPLPVAPIGRGFLSPRGLHVATTEALWFAPLLLYALWPRRRRPRARSGA